MNAPLITAIGKSQFNVLTTITLYLGFRAIRLNNDAAHSQALNTVARHQSQFKTCVSNGF